ncbi:MAG TPA: proline--tRNA ligase [Spirochaetia bacterium]|nr:proline--tRNA ligase [Spirochaetia bacterium]
MRASQLYAPTLRETPAEAEIASHRLLLRAGFIRKAAAGIYTLLPLGLKVVARIEKVVREEMDRQGGQEILLPILQPAELWLESGRWNVYGPELCRLKDRHGRDFCLGPTHEEIITTLVMGDVRSYRQLPVLLYQIQDKFRDEKRPRFGLMRGREFIMKDLYSFDRDEEGLALSYGKMYEAYTRIFTRLGLEFRAVEADSGAIGGTGSHEFMVLAGEGEAKVVFCGREECGYAANTEKAFSPPRSLPAGEAGSMVEVAADGDVDPGRVLKTVLFKTDKGMVAALVRGDREVNEIKLQNLLGLLEAEAVRAGGDNAGPVDLAGVTVVADLEVTPGSVWVTGSGREGMCLTGVQCGRDFVPEHTADIRLVGAGHPCPHCGEPLVEARGIEAGQVFKLGTKYSAKLGANFLEEDGTTRPLVMGCYGIGITRTMAAAVEQSHDERGIIWPVAMAPFEVVVVPVNAKDPFQTNLAGEIYRLLNEAGVEAVLDDRPERAGVKFKDADLIGYPYRVVVGSGAQEDGQVEIYCRRDGQTLRVPWATVPGALREALASTTGLNNG